MSGSAYVLFSCGGGKASSCRLRLGVIRLRVVHGRGKGAQACVRAIRVMRISIMQRGQLVDLSSHNANPPGVFDGEAVPMPYMADSRIAEAVAALRRFVAEHGSIPTAESWTEAAMRPSEKTIRRRFGSFKVAVATAMIDPK